MLKTLWFHIVFGKSNLSEVLWMTFTDNVESRAFVVELLGWPSYPEVLGRDPHFVSNVERNIFSAGVLLLPLLGFQDVLRESLTSLSQSLERSVS